MATGSRVNIRLLFMNSGFHFLRSLIMYVIQDELELEDIWITEGKCQLTHTYIISQGLWLLLGHAKLEQNKACV